MNVEIDHLRLQLPPGYAPRAPQIARLLAQALAQPGLLHPAAPGALASLRLPPIALRGQPSDAALARQIAQQIARQINPSGPATTAPGP